MYEYDKLNVQQRQELIQQRLKQGFPAHSPPHPLQSHTYYLLAATCYRHQKILTTSSRRQQLFNLITEKFMNNGVKVIAWVILANHYHLLVNVPDFKMLSSKTLIKVIILS